MSFDQILAGRMRKLLEKYPGYVEKVMFGGVGFLLNGNMACGVHKDHLIVRVGPENYAQALEQPYARPFDLTGRPMKGWVTVAPAGVESQQVLEAWVQQGVDFALTLPAKS